VGSAAASPPAVGSDVDSAHCPPPTAHAMLNPLRSEQEAFRFLVYVVVVVGAIVGIVLIARAIS
jgi:hypothetical protein